MAQKTAQPQPMGSYYIEGDAKTVKIALTTMEDLGEVPASDEMSPYIKMQTTQGKQVGVISVSLDIIRAFRRWNREDDSRLVFTVYQLLSNGLLRVLNERTLKSEKPVREMAKKIKNLPRRSAIAAR